MKQACSVTGMTCSACSAHVEKAVRGVPGVREVSVNLLTNSMTVDFDENAAGLPDIIRAVEKAGYGAAAAGNAKTRPADARREADDAAAKELRHMKFRLIVSFAFLLPLFYLSMGHMMGWPLPGIFHGTENAMIFAFTQLLLLLPILYVNDKYYKVGFKTLAKGAPNMDALIALGSSASLLYGLVALYQIAWGLGHGDAALVDKWSMDLYLESAGMILTLITLGKFLETRSKGKTSQAISRLMDLAPKTATVLRDGTETEVPVEEVAVGDKIVVKPGGRVPVDGVVEEGWSSVDESALTGESIPAEKGPGDKVAAASINQSGSFVFSATRVGEDTTLAQMIRLVEEASSSKAPIAKLADKVAGVFVPAVIGIALVTALVWLLVTGGDVTRALTAGVAVLVISCPCALGLATPVAIMVGTGKGAEYGILIKSAEALEALHAIDTVVLDKTGTLTEGKPRLTDLLPVGDTTREELLCVAASLEKPSEHPLAAAIVSAAQEDNIPLAPVTDFLALHGRGVQGHIQGETFFAGNRALLEEKGIPLDPALLQQADALAAGGKTPLFFARETGLMGILAAADQPKATSAQTVAAFRSMGIRVVMLTGDNARTAQAVGKALGVDEIRSEVLPQDKAQKVAELQAQGRKVAMVGDGINDAPALATADVGLAIGAGTDVAMESADIVLMKSDLLDAVTAVQLSKATIRNIKENLFWAFIYNIIGIPLAAGVWFPLLHIMLNPMFAAAAMSMSSVCVVSNALRLRLFKPRLPAGGEVPLPRPAEHQEKGEVIPMTKTLSIQGMMCPHCVAHVSKALNDIPGVTATVDLASNSATVTGEAEDAVLIQAVTDAGYTVTGIR
ncbi:heavy metal translocating P-type ATPase [Pseudoflavonifractor phocaeensis]|uniref:heavy metal translocating P-type ATPase n=1 Tax=Pseudoflavonifractor phocaeensis TaxID=1870988 RepID=UPI001958DCAF|nr:heavy metal translocating P-type ATPase [Pseudoflavonifractor phocaeensis]MBM6937321.1 heavy metal translocating P-type ATPase [Pseudoflavonifractor phocaeensis]